MSLDDSFRSRLAVPTETGVTMVRIGGLGASRAMRTTMSFRLSALSSARKITLVLRANDSMSGGISKAARSDVAADDLFQVLFEERDVALGHFDHAGAIRMAAGNRRTEIRQTGRNHRSPSIPEP